MAIDEEYYFANSPVFFPLPANFLKAFKIIFMTVQEYETHSLKKILQRLQGQNSDQIRESLRGLTFWKEVQKSHRSSISFYDLEDIDDSVGDIARRFLDYFFKNMNTHSVIHRNVNYALKPDFPGRTKAEVESFLQHLDDKDESEKKQDNNRDKTVIEVLMDSTDDESQIQIPKRSVARRLNLSDDDGDDDHDPLPPPSAAVTKRVFNFRADSFQRKMKLLSSDDQDDQTSEDSLAFKRPQTTVRGSSSKKVNEDELMKILYSRSSSEPEDDKETKKKKKKRQRMILDSDDEDELVDDEDVHEEITDKKDQKKKPEAAKNAPPARPRIALARPRPSTDFYNNQLVSDQESITDKADALFKRPTHMRGEAYEEEEDHKILIYIAQKHAYEKIKGIALWEEMSKHFKSGRTANSLKERFLTRILPKVDEYGLRLALTRDIRERFERIAAVHFPGSSKKVPAGEKRKSTVDSDKGPKRKKSHYFNRNSDDSSSEDDQEENMTEKEKEKEKVKKKAKALGKKDIDDIPLILYDDKKKTKDKNDGSIIDPYEIATTEGGYSVTKSRAPYHPNEDSKIVEYVFITKHPTALVPVSGNAYWKQAEQDFRRSRQLDRTWQSLKERFKKAIIPTLFRLTTPLNTADHRRIAAECYQKFYTQEWKAMLANYDKARRVRKKDD